jgi:hypothetical protein
LNIFVTPGEVFDEVRVQPSTSNNWVVPGLIYGLLGAIAAVLILAQPSLIQQTRNQQAKAMDDMVKRGKMTREQAERSLDTVDKITGPIMKASGAFGGLTASFITILWWGFLMWLIARFAFKTQLDFSKAMEVAGLACGISILDTIIKTLLIVILSNPFASLSLVLLIPNPTPENKFLGLAAMANPLIFWLLAVRSIGLARLTGVSTARAAAWVFPIWLLTTGAFVALGIIGQTLAQSLTPK